MKITERLNTFLADKGKKAQPYLLAAMVVGVALVLVSQRFPKAAAGQPRAPDTSAETALTSAPLRPELEVRMEEILSLVQGAGQTKVLINTAQGAERIYARDTILDESKTSETDANGGVREQNQSKSQSNIVTLNRREGGDEPLMLYENAPRIEGVIIVAEGGADVLVKDALIRAASGLLGVAVHKVTVLPMAIHNNK